MSFDTTKRRRKKKKLAHNAAITVASGACDDVHCVCLQLSVLRERLPALQSWFAEATNTAHQMAGHVLSTMVAPTSGDVVSSVPTREVIVVYAFNTARNFHAWNASVEKLDIMTKLAPLVEHASVLGGQGAVREDDANWGAYASGWDSQFVPPNNAFSTLMTGGIQRSTVPPRWKECCLIYLAVNTVVILLGLPGSLNSAIADGIGATRLPWLSPVVALLSNLVAIPVIVFVTSPIYALMLNGWLHQPKPPLPPSTDSARRFLYNTCC
jgi:antibiotic biosynthesis monooxygenase (ABM) superfamily enzyme